MNFLLSKVIKIVGIEKVFLMAWNYFLPVLLEKCKKTETVWDEKILLFVNELIIMLTGKKSGEGDAHPEITKPQVLVDIEQEVSHA